MEEANVTLMVADMDRAVSFYTSAPGVKLKARCGGHFQIGAPGTEIALHPAVRTSSAREDDSSMSIGFSVGDLEMAMRELSEKGVKFSRVTDDAHVKLAFFTDPDGNPLYFSESKWR